jgi:nucleoside-diphosphate-sugar epimerase
MDVGRQTGLAIACLRLCRYFDESPEKMAIHRLYRGADVRDIASAHVLLAEQQWSGVHLLNVAGPRIFQQQDTVELLHAAPKVIARYYPGAAEWFQSLGWELPEAIDRVYVSDRIAQLFGYEAQFGFREYVDAQLRRCNGEFS